MNYKTTGELKAIAREQLKGKYGIVILTTVLYAAISFGFAFISSFFEDATLISLGIAIIIALISAVLSLGLTKQFLNIAKEEEFQVVDLFWGFTNHPDKVIVVTILLVLIMIIPSIIMGVLIAFYVITKNNFSFLLMLIGCIAVTIAIVVISLAYAFCVMILADNKEVSAIEVLRISRKLMNGNKLRLFYLSLTFIGWSLLGLISCGVGYLWISPYMTLTTTHFYLDIKEKKNFSFEQNINEEQYM